MVDFYTILEVSHDASPEDIKRSYHRLALKYHPDKAGLEGAAKFKEISTAYQVLSDPQKKSIYDTYGETGLDAIDNPVAGGAVATLGLTVTILIAVLLPFLTAAMILIFLAFLVSYVGGHLASWNYVKVFSPLFVVDVVVGVPVIIFFFVFLAMMARRIPIHCSFLAIFCAIILTIVIPIAKDRNESRARQGRADFLKWRLWLIPGYLFSVFVFIAVFFATLPTPHRIQKLKSIGLVHLANYLPVSFIFSMLEAACVVIFFALVACRADEVITTNYFIVIGVPIFVGLTIFLINQLVSRILELYLSDVPPEVLAAARAAEEAVNGGESSHIAEPEPESNNSSNPMGGSRRSHSGPRGDGAEELHYSRGSPHYSHESSNTNGENNHQRNINQSNADTNGEDGAPQHAHSANGGKNPYAGQRGSYCSIVTRTVFSVLIVGLLMASTAMIAVRLNHYYNYGTYAGVLSLAKACIPLFIIFGVVVFALLMGVFLICCGVTSIVVTDDVLHSHYHAEAGSQQETVEEEMQANGNNTGASATQADEGAPGVPLQDAYRTRCSADHHRPSHKTGTTPPDRQPENEHLSDID